MSDPRAAQMVEHFYELLLQMTSVRVVEGSSISTKRKNDKVLFVETNAMALAELRDALRLRPLGAQFAFMTPGDPTLVFSAHKTVLMTMQYLGGDPGAIRADVLGEDALLENRDAVTAWLRKYGNGRSEDL
jgi:hypothetical protein